MENQTPDEFDIDAELQKLVLDEEFVNAGPNEAPADERVARAQRIARANNALQRDGEIADGTGKPRFRKRKRNIVVLSAAIVAVAIVLVAVIAST